MIYKYEHLKHNFANYVYIFIKKDGPHQIKHAAQHGQKQEGSLSTDIVDGANYCRTRGRHSKDECPDWVQVKLRGQTFNIKYKLQILNNIGM